GSSGSTGGSTGSTGGTTTTKPATTTPYCWVTSYTYVDHKDGSFYCYDVKSTTTPCATGSAELKVGICVRGGNSPVCPDGYSIDSKFSVCTLV
ncbi:MAG: hypothetical protein R3Y13_01525, partial [bacterium]